MSSGTQSSKDKPQSIADLFDASELKQLFIKFLILIGAVEIAIFSLCWIYQLGLKEFDRYGNVDIPFPWRTYFLLAFLVPVAITFLLGLFVVAFNNYLCGDKYASSSSGVGGKPLRRLRTGWNIISQLPFLLMLLLLGIASGVIYKMEVLATLVGRLGEGAFKIALIFGGVLLAGGMLCGLVWMILTYRLKKKQMEYQYKREVMARLGIVFLDDRTLLDGEGRNIAVDDIQADKDRRLPPVT